jgi:hypothetical protein
MHPAAPGGGGGGGGVLVLPPLSTLSECGPQTQLENPMSLFSRNAFHGGAMRCLYKFTSMGEAAALVHYLAAFGPAVAVASVSVAVAAIGRYAL